jgi:hypothetical protein
MKGPRNWILRRSTQENVHLLYPLLRDKHHLVALSVLSCQTMRSLPFLKLDIAAGVIAPSREGMFAEACNLARPDTAVSFQWIYPIYDRNSTKRRQREETPQNTMKFLFLFSRILSPNICGKFTWASNKFRQIYNKKIHFIVSSHSILVSKFFLSYSILRVVLEFFYVRKQFRSTLQGNSTGVLKYIGSW